MQAVVSGIDRADSAAIGFNVSVSIATFLLAGLFIGRVRSYGPWYHATQKNGRVPWVPGLHNVGLTLLLFGGFLLIFQAVARSLVTSHFLEGKPGDFAPGVVVPGGYTEVALAVFDSEHDASLVSGIASFFIIGSASIVLWALFFFSYHWNLHAFLMLIFDLICHGFCFAYTLTTCGDTAIAVIFSVYAGLYVLFELFVLVPMTLTGWYYDSWNGANLADSLAMADKNDYADRARLAQNSSIIYYAGLFITIIHFPGALIVTAIGSQVEWGPIVFAIIAATIVVVVPALLGCGRFVATYTDEQKEANRIMGKNVEFEGASPEDKMLENTTDEKNEEEDATAPDAAAAAACSRRHPHPYHQGHKGGMDQVIVYKRPVPGDRHTVVHSTLLAKSGGM